MTQAPANTVTLKLDGRTVTAPRGATILEAANAAGIHIPTLCYDPRLKAYGACRMCVVQQEGRPGFAAACVTPAAPDAAYRTNTPEVLQLRQSVLTLLVSEHPHGCLTCDRIVHCGPNDICLRNVSVTDRCVVCPQNQRCELQATVEITGVTEMPLEYTYRTLPVRTEDPYIDRDYNLCIACARCVRICDEVVGASAVSMVSRGDRILPGTPNDVPLSDPLSGCIFCGACVDACPVGALTEKENKWAGLPDHTVTTVCPHCEVGCQVIAEMKGDKLLRVIPDLDGGANGGLACIKGKFQLADQARREDRLLQPRVRRGGKLESVSWEEAVETSAAALHQRKGDSFALVVSGQVANEDAYLLQRFARAVMGSPNIDTTARRGASSIVELTQALGSGASTLPIRDIAKARALLVVGADIEKSHPVAAFQAHKAVNYLDAQLVLLVPSNTQYPELQRSASLVLRHAPGTEREVLAAVLKVILDEGLANQAFLGQRTEGLEALTQSLARVDVAQVAQRSGVEERDIREAARVAARVKPLSLVYSAAESDGQGIASVLADIALVTGNVGASASGISVFRPQGNTQGVHDMGCLPNMLPGYRPVGDAEIREHFSTAWEAPLPDGPGLDLGGIVQEIRYGHVTALYWVGDLPEGDNASLLEALDNVEFLLVQGMVVPEELAQRAHVLLPAAAVMEREGTYTNAERRVQRIRPFLPPPGEARPVWQGVCALARALGDKGFDYADAARVFEEISRRVPLYAGLSYERLDTGITGLQWPVDGAPEGTPSLYLSGFATPGGKAGLVPVLG
ncbi:MAG: molybdopterin-dependent oxidoreductase [Chloroflexi bacterium]|nr:molybdopterin-dependent oxidoreductase [Chloroflexota bacterium]